MHLSVVKMRLDPADYWRLRALDGDVQRHQQVLNMAQEERQLFWSELVEKYDLRDNVEYQANDLECSLSEKRRSYFKESSHGNG